MIGVRPTQCMPHGSDVSPVIHPLATCTIDMKVSIAKFSRRGSLINSTQFNGVFEMNNWCIFRLYISKFCNFRIKIFKKISSLIYNLISKSQT